MKNLHKLYYQDYFKEIAFEIAKGEMKASGRLPDIIGESCAIPAELKNQDFLDYAEGSGFHCKEFKILYPGLVTGVGIRHEASVEGEFKLGMHFDYTRGFPIVYGSSVKGVLKAYFKECYSGKHDIDALIADVFEGLSYADKQTPLSSRAAKPIYERDTFFDAIVVQTAMNGKLIASDALTPHGGTSHDDPFAEPMPIPFIKIAPGVKLRFRFKLVPTKDADGNEVMSVKDKLSLFEKILTTFGIGAKTNVGYGQLSVL